MKIVPLPLKEAHTFLEPFARHYKSSAQELCAIGLMTDDGRLHGAAILGVKDSEAQLSHIYCDGVSAGYTMLYGAAWRAFKALGYERIIL